MRKGMVTIPPTATVYFIATSKVKKSTNCPIESTPLGYGIEIRKCASQSAQTHLKEHLASADAPFPRIY
jgi:hypothetical protein